MQVVNRRNKQPNSINTFCVKLLMFRLKRIKLLYFLTCLLVLVILYIVHKSFFDSSAQPRVYSAYLDLRRCPNEGAITIVGVLKVNNPKSLYCNLFDSERHAVGNISTIAKFKLLDSDHHSQFWPFVAAYYIICSVPCDSQKPPAFVALTDDAGTPTKHLTKPEETLISIISNESEKQTFSFALCVRPIYEYDDYMEFAEWIEFYKLMGVEKFTFYNQSIGPKTSCLMKSYGDLIQVLPWADPFGNRWRGQVTAAHDCLQRYRAIADYLIQVDVDEFIVPSPSTGNNYKDMISTLNDFYYSNSTNTSIASAIGGYSFQNVHFFLDWSLPDKMLDLKIDNNPKAENILNKIVTATKILRTHKIDPHKDRSKTIVIPDNVIEIGVHGVVEYADTVEQSYATVYTLESMATNHHYRVCYDGLAEHCDVSKGRFIETWAQRFSKEIAVQVAERFESVRDECNLN